MDKRGYAVRAYAIEGVRTEADTPVTLPAGQFNDFEGAGMVRPGTAPRRAKPKARKAPKPDKAPEADSAPTDTDAPPLS